VLIDSNFGAEPAALRKFGWGGHRALKAVLLALHLPGLKAPFVSPPCADSLRAGYGFYRRATRAAPDAQSVQSGIPEGPAVLVLRG